jgi:HEAT repeat protein
MSRALAVLAACLLCASVARADTIDDSVQQLANDPSYKIRLSAALALGKSRDARAVIALADALGRDEDSTIRRSPSRRASTAARPRMLASSASRRSTRRARTTPRQKSATPPRKP